MCINWRGKDKGSEAESSAGGKTKKKLKVGKERRGESWAIERCDG